MIERIEGNIESSSESYDEKGFNEDSSKSEEIVKNKEEGGNEIDGDENEDNYEGKMISLHQVQKKFKS